MIFNNILEKTWFKLSDKIRFVFVGGLNALVSYLLYVIFFYIIGSGAYQISLALAWAFSSIFSYTSQKFLVFQTKNKNILKEYFKCCITWFFSYLVNAVLLEILVSKIHINAYFAQIFATIIAAIFTYIMFKIFAFKKS